MALTGIPLILLAVLATAAVGTATALLWSRYGRWRLVSRTLGVLLCEVLAVLTVGLVANRHEQFYPSWQALAGRTGTTGTTAAPPAGRLDDSLGPDRLRLPWRPPSSVTWGLASPAQVAVPQTYLTTHGAFPALLALGGQPTVADLVRVVANPGRQTTAAALAGLPGRLAQDLRVTGHGWVLVAAAPAAVLATELIRADPGQFAALAIVGTPPRGFTPPPGVAVAVAVAVRPPTRGGPKNPARHGAASSRQGATSSRQGATSPRQGAESPRHGAASTPRRGDAGVDGTVLTGVTYLTGSWAAATSWAVDQTALPLAAPEVLPTAEVR
ncbi:MAG: hypothetical protein QOE51_1016 [Actinoplanes sp.]|jgi:lysyl-tRNA synthetase class 2|nr:hypothetical protein [Actinoplanes sp.]